jgi:hypothetical protein
MKRILMVAAALLYCTSIWAAAPPAESGNVGMVKVASPGLCLKIVGPKNKYTGKPEEVPLPSGQDVKLPANTYEVAAVGLMAQDAQRNLWTLTSTKTMGKLGNFQVSSGQTTSVEGGGPLQIKASARVGVPAAVTVAAGCATPSVPGMSSGASGGTKTLQAAASNYAPKNSSTYAAKNQANQKTVTILLQYVGQAGEVYSPRVQKGRSIGPAPTVRIVDSQSNVLAQGPYGYGGSTPGGG